MTKAKNMTVNMIKDNYFRFILGRTIFISLFIVLLVYLYFVSSITFNVIARRSFENKIQSYSSSISKLELTYFSEISKINKDYAISNGFVDANNNLFAIRSKNYVAIR